MTEKLAPSALIVFIQQHPLQSLPSQFRRKHNISITRKLVFLINCLLSEMKVSEKNRLTTCSEARIYIKVLVRDSEFRNLNDNQ
jgi:hypothetical protein